MIFCLYQNTLLNLCRCIVNYTQFMIDSNDLFVCCVVLCCVIMFYLLPLAPWLRLSSIIYKGTLLSLSVLLNKLFVFAVSWSFGGNFQRQDDLMK